MKIDKYKKLGKMLSAEKVGKDYYYFSVYPYPVLRKNKLSYWIYATNIKTEKNSKPVVYIPIEVLIITKKDKLLIELNKYKNKLKKKLLESQNKRG